jgi:hypothetical protein
MGIWPFGKKGTAAPRQIKGAPIDRVRSLSSQGLSEPEIIRTLKDEGYTPIEVDGAMRNVLKGAVGGFKEPLPGPSMNPAQRDYQRPASEEFDRPGPPRSEEFEGAPKPPFDVMERAGPLDMPRIPGEKRQAFAPEEEYYEQPPRVPRLSEPQEQQDEDEEIEPFRVLGDRAKDRKEVKEEKRRAVEELIESVIDEKWGEFKNQMEDVDNRFHQTESKIIELEQTILQIRGEKKTEIESIETKIDTYKQSINEVGERMESVERAMKDSLTPMLQSLRSLSDTIKSMKGNK